MARYPFMTYVNDLMTRMKDVYADITWDTVMRRYRRINKDILKLHQEGKISTTSPVLMTVDDVRAYLTYRYSLKYSGKEYSHDQSAMKKLFEFSKNIAFENCLMLYPALKARKNSKRLPPMEDDLYKKILGNASKLRPNDFLHHRAYCLVLLCARTGCRTKEIRLIEMKDLDTEEWELNIAHVKGEDSYGEPRSVPIKPEVRPIIESYLLLRKNWLIANSMESDALFPSKITDDGFLTTNSLRKIKGLVEKETDAKFDFRTLRRTYGQQLIDSGVDIESVSVSMGHATTKTTEGFYARKRNSKANDRIRQSW
jgi:Site-specific recombinase XerD